jgi:hypothetical protein
MGVRGLRASLAATVLVLAGCQIVQVSTPDPAEIPSGSLEAGGPAAIGPVIELGSGISAGVGWRYATFESDDGWCTQLEMQAVTETGCGQILPEEGAAFGTVSHSGPVVHGVVTAETATVWLIAEDGSRVAFATLMPLEDAGLEGQGFVGIAAAGTNLTHVMALKLNGEVLETYELP